jgi:hypothetical protein
LLSLSGCTGRAWKSALREDTPAAYYRFMRDHRDSKFAEQARERLAFHKLKRSPSLAGYQAFRQQYPGSELIAALHPVLEEPAFEAARAWGTAEAYRSFLTDFPGGAFAARAEGNAVYIEASGFGGDPGALQTFAAARPQSDFAEEAMRTVVAGAARRAGRIDRIGLVMEIDSATPGAKRVREALVDRIEELTERVGLELVDLSAPAASAGRVALPKARLEVSHRETNVESDVQAGAMRRPAVLGVTRVVLRESEGGEVIADRRFELRVDDKAHVPGTSVLFSAVSPKYWDDFFVPLARWRNDSTVRPPIATGSPIVDIDGFGDRALVLHENGSFELLGLSNPLEPVRLSEYLRPDDFKKWSGIRVVGSQIAIYGEEGLELVRFTAQGPVAETAWDRTQIGRVLSIAPLGDQLVLVGNKGMQLLDLESGAVRRVMRRAILSVAAAGDSLIFVDGESIYVSTLALLAENRVIAQMKLGRTFGPNNVRVLDRAAIVTGPGGALVVDMRNPQAPKALAKLSTREVGEIEDATRIRGRTFLVGMRGLQLLTRDLRRVEEMIDVGSRNRVAVMGRHLVTADSLGIQIVDATPWADHGAPAASASRSPQTLLNGSGF